MVPGADLEVKDKFALGPITSRDRRRWQLAAARSPSPNPAEADLHS